MKSTIELRQDFIDFFRENDHKYLAPSKVFNDDPTLMFVNAGMNQLKNIFLGRKEINPKFTKLTNAQICIRAGGKHNDLDDVGYDSYHLTSFTMLGNWSLNQYQKEDAIQLAFEYLVRSGLNPEQMYVTYFAGSGSIPPDTETRELWEKWMPSERIIPSDFKDNFWMMADYGPCGVSTEIHYDTIGSRFVPELVNQDDPTVIEIWNLVFIEYNRDTEGFKKLDKFYVDTGMGLERLAMILQNKKTVYQTDSFLFLLGYAQALSGADMFMDTYEGDMVDISYRIFVDHIRTVVVALFDGVKFGPSQREYVLRKIFRRLLTYFYVHLCKCRIIPRMNHPMVKCMISDILNFYLKKKHDADKIWNQLIIEENLFIGKIRHIPRKFEKHMRELDNNRDLTIGRLIRTEGIPLMIIENCENLVFT